MATRSWRLPVAGSPVWLLLAQPLLDQAGWAAKKTTFTKTVAVFSDANAGSTVADFTGSIAWGDGGLSTGTVTALPGGGFAVGGSHRYDSQGSYSVAVHVQDVGGSSADTVAKVSATSK